MTPEELEIVRFKVKILALETVLDSFCNAVASSSPTAPAALRMKFQDFRKKHSKIVLPGYSAEYSDLLAGEYQEALDDILTKLENGLP